MARKTQSQRMTKRCTKSGEEFTGTFDELTEFFYRDKSQKDGLSPWSKAAERAYNKAYRDGLKEADAPRKSDIADASGEAAFESAMAPERVVRKRGTKNANEVKTSKAATARKRSTVKRDGTRSTTAKAATKKRTAARKTKVTANKA